MCIKRRFNALSRCTFSKKGYCTLMNSGEPKNLPLPLSGYKILTAHCTEPLSNHSKHIKYAMSEIRRLYPHINSISDLTPEILSTAKSSFKNSKAAKYMYHLSTENTRINTVSAALKRCDIKTLFREINNSEQSMERFGILAQNINSLQILHATQTA